MLAITVDVFILSIIWELLAKIKSLNLLFRVFLVIFSVLIIDTLIFTTGVFFDSGFYASVLGGNLLVRLVLSALAAPIITLLLKSEGFVEAKRSKPQNFWEILNFSSDLEIKISNLEETIKKNKLLEDKLKKATENYELVLTGSGAIIWDWNLLNNQFSFSEMLYKVLGYKPGVLKNNLDTLKSILHPEDSGPTFQLIEKSISTGQSYEAEFRLKLKSGKYRWFSASGVVKYDENKKPFRMVGSIIDIDGKKQSELKIQEKIDELSALNKFMIGRELKMVELKSKINELENKNK
jgi:PAS domain S-box-containing protein